MNDCPSFRTSPKFMHNQGFTLVELAIALMVIGLLIGGVLKGQELIENARVTAFVRQIKAYDTAAMIFRNTYGALPGDIKKPNRIPNCTTAPCNTPGNGSSRIHDDTPQAYEAFNFFPHLTKAGMIQGPEGGTSADMATAVTMFDNNDAYVLFFPKPIFESVIGFNVRYMNMSGSTIPQSTGNTYYIAYISNRARDQIDSKIDDGSACKGEMYTKGFSQCEDSGDMNQGYVELLGEGEDPTHLRVGF